MTFVLMLPAAAAFGQWEPGEPVALDVVCDGEYRTQVYIDGQQGDWDAESPAVERVMQLVAGGYQYDWTGPNDASFKYWCRYNEHGLSFAVVGRDNVILAPDGSSPGDRMELWMELDRPGTRTSERVVMVEIPIWPVLTDRYTTPVWGAGAGRSGELTTGRAELAPTETGFFLEFNVPFLAVGEYAEPYAPMRFMLVQRDWDNDAEIEEEVAVGTSPLVTDEPEQWGWMRFTGETDIAGQVRETLSYGPAVHNTLLKRIIAAADKEKITFQRAAVSRATGTDTDAFAYGAAGVPSALISLPLRYMHTTVESVHKDDVEDVIRLILASVRALKSGEDLRYIK